MFKTIIQNWLKEIVKSTPNDQELGAKIRQLVYETELENKANNKSSDD
tara:strand:+ start:92 stop:235 length:144 start_codon:yes stop_codon:yes gene_type:complete